MTLPNLYQKRWLRVSERFLLKDRTGRELGPRQFEWDDFDREVKLSPGAQRTEDELLANLQQIVDKRRGGGTKDAFVETEHPRGQPKTLANLRPRGSNRRSLKRKGQRRKILRRRRQVRQRDRPHRRRHSASSKSAKSLLPRARRRRARTSSNL